MTFLILEDYKCYIGVFLMAWNLLSTLSLGVHSTDVIIFKCLL